MDPTNPYSLAPVTPRRSPLVALIIGILLLAALALGALAAGFAATASKDKAALSTAAATAAAAAQKAQAKKDQVTYAELNASPFQTYTSPSSLGPFSINFPKSWSATVSESSTDQTQVDLIMNPGFIRTEDGTPNLHAAEVIFSQRTISDYGSQYMGQSGITEADIMVSGIKGQSYTGTFGDNRTTRVVLVPVRNEVIAFINEDAAYASDFNTILAQAKIIP
jgi:hypothetical protein